jgi:polyribonucleotide 5'-hydroxyl-kinase
MEREERDLTPESELRFEVGELQSVTVQLLEGYAEIFGVEMAQQKEYSFVDQNFSIFTWYGCKIGISGSYKTIYDSTDTNMISIVNTHAQLEARRDVALANNESGPRVSILTSIIF